MHEVLKHEVVKKETSILMMLVTAFGVVIVLFFAKMLYDMTYYVGIMSQEIVSMNKKVDKMSEGMEAMNVYMGEMNIHVKNIQSNMARDINSMSHSVKQMSHDITSMQKDMNKGVGKLSPMGMAKSMMHR